MAKGSPITVTAVWIRSVRFSHILGYNMWGGVDSSISCLFSSFRTIPRKCLKLSGTYLSSQGQKQGCQKHKPALQGIEPGPLFLAGKWTKPATTTKETNENKTINKVQNPIRAQVHSCISFCRMSQPTTSSVNFCDFIINYMFSSLALPSEWWDTHIIVKIHAKWCTVKPLMDLKPWYAAIAKPHSPSP